MARNSASSGNVLSVCVCVGVWARRGGWSRKEPHEHVKARLVRSIWGRPWVLVRAGNWTLVSSEEMQMLQTRCQDRRCDQRKGRRRQWCLGREGKRWPGRRRPGAWAVVGIWIFKRCRPRALVPVPCRRIAFSLKSWSRFRPIICGPDRVEGVRLQRESRASPPASAGHTALLQRPRRHYGA